MTRKILFSVDELHSLQAGNEHLIVDCRFDLGEPDKGYQAYLKAHIPGAVYAHLDNDLSSPVTSTSGRHPLPDADRFALFLGRSGWRPGMTLVAYDDAGGAIAARLWWLMKYFGHDSAAMLDGGVSAWQAAAYGFDEGQGIKDQQSSAKYSIQGDLVMSTLQVKNGLADKDLLLVDARAAGRFNGDNEPIDTVAGHIPGAVNYPYDGNLDGSGLFKATDDIRREHLKLVGNNPSSETVHMCGSGVTACHNLFAAELAGLEPSKLYVGSWSEWIRDPSRPIGP
jgi:thiosulfate/3-mercaptopyruvate sulfurtransferase